MKYLIFFSFAVISMIGIPGDSQGRSTTGRDFTFSWIPVPENSLDVSASRLSRARVPLYYALKARPSDYVGARGDGLPWIVLSHLTTASDVTPANEAILHPSTKPFALSGTYFDGLGALCKRNGDYDFALRAWTYVLYRFWNRPDRLWPQSKTKILHTLLNETGNQVALTRSICGISVPETENHILMTESSRYLTNQLLNRERRDNGQVPLAQYDNEKNGMNRFLRRYLAEFLKTDFSEYNSKPYISYTTMPLLNLVEYAEDSAVRLIARMVLASLDIKMAIGSADLLRFPPFRRLEEDRKANALYEYDGEAHRSLMLTGLINSTARLKAPYLPQAGFDIMTYFALSNYNIPSLILDWYFPAQNPQAHYSFFRMKHRAIEIVSRAPEYILSAGGAPYQYHALFPHEDGWAVPTTFIPSKGRPFLDETIRFLGHYNDWERNNSCVAPNFMCGVNLRWPITLPEKCIQRSGNWVFINGMTSECPELGWDTMVAVYQDHCNLSACRGIATNWGFAQAYAPHSSAIKLSFQEFASKILAENQNLRFGPTALNQFRTIQGDIIRFRPLVFDVRRSNIEAINNQAITLDMKRWPYISGSHWNADGRGRMEYRHPETGRRLIFDVANPDAPQ